MRRILTIVGRAPLGHLFATQFVDKKSSTAQIIDLPNAAGVSVVSGALHVHDGTVVRRIIDEGDSTAAQIAAAVAATAAAVVSVAGVAAGYKIARGKHQQAAASDTVITGLTTVVAVVASFRDSPTVKQLFVQASEGDQAGTPAAGSILIKTFKPTAVNDVTPTPATDFTENLNIDWIAVGT